MHLSLDRVNYICAPTPPRATAPDFHQSWHSHVFHACHTAKREERTDLSLRAKIAIEGAIMALPAPVVTGGSTCASRPSTPTRIGMATAVADDDGNVASYAGFADLLVAVWDAIDNPLVRGVVTEEQVLVYAETQERRAPKMGV
ncbi:hypothetical protein CFIMG_007634RA00001 [Ceratocystis fimbriata CBS 114723]|uniref:Uncharacterized protein n=1 Tax=Ceratocystis fimbriata CBS 114723 TaxID=1035309 RepID=A0A2C5XEK2_9PEZI|nr:hypothetical protein CFIMG_007634RA00001 [Ceratocystis fimbriata CBS 114723]